jgi:hypothetical protein
MNSRARKMTVGFFMAATLTACNTLSDVKKELAKGGFELWYPAEANIEPGQVWFIKGDGKTEVYRRPVSLSTKEARDVRFSTLEKQVDANASLSANFAKGLLGKAATLQAELSAGTVKKVSLDFGNTQVERVIIEDLNDVEKRAKFSEDYRAGLDKVRNEQPGWVLLIATVRTSGMKYVLDVDDTAKFKANVEGAVNALLGADAKINYEGKNTVTLTIPNTQQLTIGFAPVNPELLKGAGFGRVSPQISDAELIKAVSRALNKATLPQ